LPSVVTPAMLIDLCAAEFGLAIEYPGEGIGQRGRGITLRSERAYTKRELWDYTHTVLEQAGWTTVVSGGDAPTYRVVALGEAFDRAAPIERVPDPAPGYMVERYGIAGLDAEVLESGLASMRPALGQTVVLEPGGAVLAVGAVARRHARIRSYIDQQRAAAALVETEFVRTSHRDGAGIVASLSAHFGRSGVAPPGGSLAPGPRDDILVVTAPRGQLMAWRGLIERFDVPAGAVVRVYPVAGHDAEMLRALIQETVPMGTPRGSGDRWKVVGSPMTGSLVVTASPDEHEAIERLVARIVATPPGRLRGTRLYEVKNRKAAELRATVSRLMGLDEPLKNGGRSDGDAAIGGSGSGAVRSGGDDPVSLTVDDELNSIIASGSSATLDRIGRLIEELDIRKPQVLLEVLLVSLSEGESRDLGVEIQARLGTSGVLTGLGSLFGLSSVDPSSTSPEVGGNGGSAVILDPGDFSVVLRALETVSDGRSVSTARTLVNNNETASLSNTVSEPYAEVVFDDGDSITGFGGTESAGTTISVSPQIASGGFLVLDYNISLSAFLGESTPGLPPASQSTSISSIATIPDGHSIVVGGLELVSQSGSTSKTPLLGDVPILGQLFRSDSASASRTRFYLFIRASVMRSPGFESLRYMSDLRAEELGVGRDDPEVDPVILR